MKKFLKIVLFGILTLSLINISDTKINYLNNNNEIEKDVLMDELTIIADLMTKQLDEGKTKKSIKKSNMALNSVIKI